MLSSEGYRPYPTTCQTDAQLNARKRSAIAAEPRDIAMRMEVRNTSHGVCFWTDHPECCAKEIEMRGFRERLQPNFQGKLAALAK
jgi:hypothetical protein